MEKLANTSVAAAQNVFKVDREKFIGTPCNFFVERMMNRMRGKRKRGREIGRTFLEYSEGKRIIRAMILIRFPNPESKREALGKLPGRFAFKSWKSGEMMVPEDALAFLAVEGILFSVEGPATYERNLSPVRIATTTPVQ